MDAVIAASKSVVSSDHLKKVLEVILAFGNYMNSSKRGGAFGFKLQSLDVVSKFHDTVYISCFKSTNFLMTLHYSNAP